MYRSHCPLLAPSRDVCFVTYDGGPETPMTYSTWTAPSISDGSIRTLIYGRLLLFLLTWVYRNMYMAEDYNSQQSVYWCLKSLVVVGLSADSAFWTAQELPYPRQAQTVEIVPAPQQILCNVLQGNHHFMLTPGQFVAWPMKANQAKYCKFAYSSAFGFSVPTGPLLQQMPPDNQLLISRDGAESWATKWKCEPVEFCTIQVELNAETSITVPTAQVKWYPWGDRAVSVDTVLIPPNGRWPDWHVRIHRIKALKRVPSVHIVEGGFAIHSRRKKNLMHLPVGELMPESVLGSVETAISSDDSTVVASADGASGISTQVKSAVPFVFRSSALRVDANTNLVRPRTIIPTSSIDMKTGLREGHEVYVISSIFAISTRANGGHQSAGPTLKQKWDDAPVIDLDNLGKYLK